MAEEIRKASAAHIGVVAALTEVERITSGLRSVPLFEHGTLLVKFYAPRGHDAQTPHTRDEVYVIAQGRGIFFDGTERRPFAAGDMLFVAAGITHRFEQFSGDFGTWVMFTVPKAARPERLSKDDGLLTVQEHASLNVVAHGACQGLTLDIAADRRQFLRAHRVRHACRTGSE